MLNTLARNDMKKHFVDLPDRDLAYLVEGTEHFDAVMEAQRDLVEIVHTLKQVVCVKG